MAARRAFDPTDYTTWTTFGDHPIYGPTKSQIAEWSLDPSQYSSLDDYGDFMPEYYVHLVTAPAVEKQVEIADRDIANLASACEQIQNVFGKTQYEMVILDDLTVYVWLRQQRFAVEIYPIELPNEDNILTLWIDSPEVEVCEYRCRTVPEVVEALRQVVST